MLQANDRAEHVCAASTATAEQQGTKPASSQHRIGADVTYLFPEHSCLFFATR